VTIPLGDDQLFELLWLQAVFASLADFEPEELSPRNEPNAAHVQDSSVKE
jgi:hypothetical protein